MKRIKRRTARLRQWRDRTGKTDAGFTLAESLAVVVLVVILMAIAAPSWLSFRENWTLNAAQDRVVQELRLTQSQAQRSHETWQFSLRQAGQNVQVASHPANTPAAANAWQNLQSAVRILNLDGVPDTTILYDNIEGVYQVQFNPLGAINGQLGKVTLTMGSGRSKRCVVISTLLGVLRRASNSSCVS